jgi:tRNA A-37 threonylcarbamoyl transferase component Bud32
MDPSLADRLVARAASLVGLPSAGTHLLRSGSHVMFMLPGGPVARVGDIGTSTSATRELAAARWLARHKFPAVRPAELPGVEQPTVIDGYPITWWQPIPPHRHATPAELGRLLRQLHNLPVPGDDLSLPDFAPFDGLSERIAPSSVLDDDERTWLTQYIDSLKAAYTDTAVMHRSRVMHGDAWQGNIAVPHTGEPVLLDLEAMCLGPTEWDLIPIAVDFVDFARLSAEDYQSFVHAYGRDITTSADFRILADIQEVRWTTFVIGLGKHNPAAAHEAHTRISCLQGRAARPWTWQAF